MSEVTFRRCDATGAKIVRDTVALIHCDARADQIESGHPFYAVEAFLARFDAYTSRGGFDLVMAYHDGEPVGQAWGWPLEKNTGWWRGLTDAPEPGFTDEDGKRTFAFSELMVRREWTGQGIAHALHDELLAVRQETRTTLLVRPDNVVAYRAYTRWGWQKVAQLRPNVPHAPVMDVLILPLPLPV